MEKPELEERRPRVAAGTQPLTPDAPSDTGQHAGTSDSATEPKASKQSDRERFFEKTVRDPYGCLLWTAGKTASGHGKFLLHGRTMLAHRVAWLFTYGEMLTSDQLVLHSCGTAACVEISHLRIGTHSENMKDRAAHGHYDTSRGMNNPFARFTDLQVSHMRGLINAGIDHPWIAELFECSLAYVRKLAKGELRTRPTSDPTPAALAQRGRDAVAKANRKRISEITSVVHPDDEIVGEEWRATSFEGYVVSSLGRVRGRRMTILKPYINVHGYAVVHCGKGNPQHVNVLVCEAWHGPRPAAGMHAAHNNGKPLDNTPDNLRWATPGENNRDRIRHGTVPRGTAHHLAKLTPDKAKAIRAQLPGPRGTINRLAREFGVCKTTITNIRDNIIWRE